MASQQLTAQVENAHQDLPSCYPDHGTGGAPTSCGSTENPRSELQEMLCDITQMLIKAYTNLVKHQYVPYQHVCQHMNQKLEEVAGTNRSLVNINEHLKSRCHDLTYQVERLDEVMRQKEKAHSESLSNAADRIADQDRKIGELLAQIEKMGPTEGQTLAASDMSSSGKRQRPDIVKHELDLEEKEEATGQSRKRRQMKEPNEGEAEYASDK